MYKKALRQSQCGKFYECNECSLMVEHRHHGSAVSCDVEMSWLDDCVSELSMSAMKEQRLFSVIKERGLFSLEFWKRI